MALYVGLDPADVSISQARERYREMAQRGGGGGGRGGGRGGRSRRPPRLFDARFQVKDCFAETIADVGIVKEVGIGPESEQLNYGGFDIVSMMFCMHYAFESEEKAQMMIKNVSRTLKKGGRFIGCIPNSEVIAQKVCEFNEKMEQKKAAQKVKPAEDKTAEDKTAAGEDGEIEEGEAEEGEAEPTAAWGNELYRV